VKRKILFLTATRADFGKLKPLIQVTSTDSELDYAIVATGMHLDDRYGRTEREITKCGFQNVLSFSNEGQGDRMDLSLARTIEGLSKIVIQVKPDLLVVHGDRVETLGGAISGALNNVLVAHVEGGEFSGTVDESLRHSVTKLSHIHYVANDTASDVILQLGERPESVWTIGSPEVDIMLSPSLPPLSEIKAHYEIEFDDFAILVFHPVTTELGDLDNQIRSLATAIRQSDLNYVAVYPNNDHGSSIILNELLKLAELSRVRLIPSIRFEAFQTLLKYALFIIGNSSSGVREAPVHGTPAINIGSRQARRGSSSIVVDVPAKLDEILRAIRKVKKLPRTPSMTFGDGNSANRFIESLHSERLWNTPLQKEFWRR